ncbi:MAG TPA: 16S rRNA (cytosine(1402)-N(4))-methyltransferase RsmH [Gemmatimonadaceae bacterium]|nr:16S rRNA (cytosine(1402)-N(4))-methyltransferase RsmH [Gemmatimonadaceae bacterium]
MNSAYHAPVLAAEVLQFLGNARRVFDGTLGGGGHAALLLEHGAAVIGVDRDPAARAETGRRLSRFVESGKLTIIDSTFAEAVTGDEIGFEPFDGALLDLGVSSHQLDDEARGFTFREGAALDMRMSGQGARADAWLNSASADDLAHAFHDYGDEPKARKLAATIVRRRQTRAFETSDDLVGAIRATLGPRSGAPDFARLFQAVRIAINGELEELETALPAIRDRLAPGGVLVVIAYHSGEDRLVKRAFQEWSRDCVCPPRQPMCTCGGVALGTLLTRKPVTASPGEIERNHRARSAKLRAWQRALGSHL